MMLESLDKHDQGVREKSGGIGIDRNESEVSEPSGVDVDGRTHRSAPTNRDPSGGGSGVPAGGGVPASGGVRVPMIGAGGAGGQGAGGTQAGGLPTKSMGVVDWAKVIDGYRQSQRAEQTGAEAQGSDGSFGVLAPVSSAQESGQSGAPVTGQSSGDDGAEGGGSVTLEPTDAVEVARERKARAVERVVEGLRDDTFYNALMRGVEDPRELQRKREEYRRKGAAWRSMVSLADMVANAIDAYGADRNAYTLERGLGTARYDKQLARELSRLDSEYRLAEELERDALGKMQGRKDRASAVELQDARDDLAGAKAERAERARRAREEEEKKYRADRDKVHDNQWEKEQKYRADRDKVKDDQWEKEFKAREEDRKARRGLQARRVALQARGGGSGGSGRGAVRGGRGGSSGGGISVMFDVYGRNQWKHQLWVPAGREKEFREAAIKYGRSHANWLIKNNPVYVRTYAAQMGLPTKGVSTSDLLQRLKTSGNMDDMYAGLATTSRGFLLSRCVLYGDGECLSRVMEETVSGVRKHVLRGLSGGDSLKLERSVAKSIKADAEVCGVSKEEMYRVYESEMYAGVGDNAVGRVDQFMDNVARLL